MGQVTSKNYQVSCTYDFSVEGGAIGSANMGVALPGGNTIMAIYYRVIIPLVTAAVNIDAGYGFTAGGIPIGTGFVNPADTVAALNGGGNWKQNTIWTPRQIAVGSTLDCGIYFTTPALITAGRMIFSFNIMQNPM